MHTAPIDFRKKSKIKVKNYYWEIAIKRIIYLEWNYKIYKIQLHKNIRGYIINTIGSYYNLYFNYKEINNIKKIILNYYKYNNYIR